MLRILFTVFTGCLLLPAAALADSPQVKQVARISYPGMEKISYRYGPINVNPGSNDIQVVPIQLFPRKPGYITRFEPNLVRASNGKEPGIGSLHFHHAGWAVNGKPLFAAGEEKTIVQFPRGFGVQVNGAEHWDIYYMLHNWVNTPERVYITWTMDFVPMQSPARIRGLSTQWMGVAKDKLFPVFDAIKGSGRGGKYTFPDQAKGRDRALRSPDQSWVLSEDRTLVYSTGHLHPGGLYMDLKVTREGRTLNLLRSRAVYFSDKPKSYDFAMTAPPPGWRVQLKRGDRVEVSATVDTASASWRDSMGIMPVTSYPGHSIGGFDPFRRKSFAKTGKVTHSSLPENAKAGGAETRLPDPRSLPDGPIVSRPIPINQFRYQLGDFSSPSASVARPPVVDRGQKISFVNLDSAASRPYPVYHTVTACAAPCSGTSGAAFPVESGPVSFDSGQLGVTSNGRPPASGRLAWTLPADMPDGTYTFFCRIHPEMRGAFRVKDVSGSAGLSAGWPALRG